MDNNLLIDAMRTAANCYPAVKAYLSADALSLMEEKHTHYHEEYKKVERDPDEPGLKKKKRTERRLKKIIAARLARQAKEIQKYLRNKTPTTTPIQPTPASDRERELLIKVVREGALDGVGMAEETIGFSLSDGSVNERALSYAQSYTTEWLRKIDSVSSNAVRDVTSTFISRPGTTVGDMVDALAPYFGEDRAWTIATTETTRIYAEANQIYANELASQYPGFEIVKRYYTNNDDRVCPICAPQNGKEAPYNDEFAIPNPPLHVNCRCWTSITVKA
jgi:SPP1 gp7 family putative phage head morphogenesis protein